MGIKNLFPLIRRYTPSAIKYKNITDYRNTTIAIDTNLMIYKMVYAIRKHGTDIKNKDIIVTHIHALLLKLNAFRRYDITPVFVFDNVMPSIKSKTMDARNKFRKDMKHRYDKATTEDEKKRYYYLKSSITYDEISECMELIKLFGYTIIIAPLEADPQLAYMSKTKIVDYVVTDDMDILLFGGINILKNFTIDKKKEIIEINSVIFKKMSKIDQKGLIDLGILLGCDYCSGKKGVGIVAGYKLVTKKKHIGVMKTIDGYSDTYRYFSHPTVKKNIIINKLNLDKNALQNLLYKLKFSDKYIYTMLQNK